MDNDNEKVYKVTYRQHPECCEESLEVKESDLLDTERILMNNGYTIERVSRIKSLSEINTMCENAQKSHEESSPNE